MAQTKRPGRAKNKARGRVERTVSVEPPYDEAIEVKIRHVIPDDVDLIYSDNIIVQHTPAEFTITFSQVQQPIALREEDYARISNVTAKVVARIVLTPLKMLEFIETLQKNWAIFDRRFKQLVHAARLMEAQDVSTAADTPVRPDAGDADRPVQTPSEQDDAARS